MIKAIIFDCFGVLITDALSQMVENLRATDPQKAERVVGLFSAAHSGNITPNTSRQAIATEFGMTLQQYMDTMLGAERKNEALFDYITSIKPNYKTAILSNVAKGGLSLRFTNAELQQYFDAVVESGVITYAKPQLEAYEYTAKLLNAETSECVFVDDREIYCEGARNAGMYAVQYTSVDQLKHELENLQINSR